MRAMVIFLALAISALPATPEDRPACELERSIAAAAEQHDFSGSILVAHKGLPVVTLYRGQLSEPGSGAIGEETRFNLGSAGKMFTAVAIGQLVDKGKLRLDEPIGEVIQGLTPAASQVTIRQLLNHTSGLGDFFKPENMPLMLRARSAGELLPLIAKESPDFAPGSRFSYSNSGFLLLGIAIERLSGLTYGEYLQQGIFLPAEMNSTGLDPRPLATLAVGMTYADLEPEPPGPAASSPGATSASPHNAISGAASSAPIPDNGRVLIGPGDGKTQPAANPKPSSLHPAPGAREGYGSPAGGMFSTAADLNRFAVALEGGKLLSRSLVDALFSPQVQVAPPTASGPARYYGFGFGISDVSGARWVGHNGGTMGANIEFWFDPNGEWTVVVLANRDPPIATQMMRQIRLLISEPTTTASVCR